MLKCLVDKREKVIMWEREGRREREREKGEKGEKGREREREKGEKGREEDMQE